MRFAIAASILAAGAMAAESTVYSTEYKTITSCGPEVTNCPARSTIVSSSSYPVSIISNATTSSITYSNTTSPVAVPSAATITASTPAITTPAAECASFSVQTISTSITTVIPTVIYSTISVACPTSTSSAKATASTGFPSPSNGTATYPSTTAIVTAGAASMGSSLLFGVAAGIAGMALA